jgi:hypothetical protein
MFRLKPAALLRAVMRGGGWGLLTVGITMFLAWCLIQPDRAEDAAMESRLDSNIAATATGLATLAHRDRKGPS